MFARKEVLVNAQDPRTLPAGSFRHQARQKVLKVAFHGGCRDGLALTDPTAADAIPMIPEHLVTERLGSMLSGQQAGKTFPEAPPAIAALPQEPEQPQIDALGGPAFPCCEASDPDSAGTTSAPYIGPKPSAGQPHFQCR